MRQAWVWGRVGHSQSQRAWLIKHSLSLGGCRRLCSQVSLCVAGSTVIDCNRNRLQELQECENKKRILLLSFIQGSDTPSKKRQGAIIHIWWRLFRLLEVCIWWHFTALSPGCCAESHLLQPGQRQVIWRVVLKGEERNWVIFFCSRQTVRGKPLFTPALTCEDTFLERLNTSFSG